MIREAIDKIIELSDMPQQQIGDRNFMKAGYTEIPPPRPKALTFYTLTSLVGFINNIGEVRDVVFVHVANEGEVRLVGELDSRQCRKLYAVCNPLIDCSFKTGQWMTQDAFVTDVQAYFEDTADRHDLLKIVGNIRSEKSATLEDDGITQRVETAAGVVSKQMEDMPNPVRLCPFTTFPEVEQPTVEYVCRFRGNAQHEHPQFALFRIPNPVFSFNVCKAIKEWLAKELPTIEVLG